MARPRLLLTVAALLAFPLACHVTRASGDPRAVALAVGVPVLLNLVLCFLFARTLRAGSEPLVTRFARAERGGELPAELARYTRRLTAAWAAFFALMAATSAGLALWGSLGALWSWPDRNMPRRRKRLVHTSAPNVDNIGAFLCYVTR